MIEFLLALTAYDVSEEAIARHMNWIADNSEIHLLETTGIPTVVIPTIEDWLEFAKTIDPEDPTNLAGHYNQWDAIITMNPAVSESEFVHEIAHHMQYQDPTTDFKCTHKLEVQAYEIEIAWKEERGLDTSSEVKLRNNYLLEAAFVCGERPHHTLR